MVGKSRVRHSYDSVRAVKGILQTLGPTLLGAIYNAQTDSNNTTSETVLSGGTYTGTWTAVSSWAQAAVVVTTSKDTAADGVVFEHSIDGSTVIHSHSYTMAAGENRHFDVPLLCSYFRVTVTDDGGGGNLDLEVATKLYRAAPTVHNHALSEAVGLEHQAGIVRSFIEGFEATGTSSLLAHLLQTTGGDAEVAQIVALIDAASQYLEFYKVDEIVPATPLGIASMVRRVDAPSLLGTASGDWGLLQISENGGLWVALMDGSGAIIDTFAGTEYEYGRAVTLTDETEPKGPTVMWEVEGGALSLLADPVDGDWSHGKLNDYGAQWTILSDTSGAAITTFGVAEDDDADFSPGTTQGTPAMGVYESTPSSVTDGDLGVVAIDGNRRQRVAGSSDDDAADDGSFPVKTGTVTDTSYDAPTADTHPGDSDPTDNADAAQDVSNSRRERPVALRGIYYDLSDLVDDYDDVTATRTVDDLDTFPYREFNLSFSLTLTGSPGGDIRVEVFTSRDGSNYSKLMNDGMANLVYSDATISSTITRSVWFRARASYMRVVVTATGAGLAAGTDEYTVDYIDLEASD